MNYKDNLCLDSWGNSSSSNNELPGKLYLDNPSFSNFSSQQKWEETSVLDYGITIESPFQEFNGSQFSLDCNQMKFPTQENVQMNDTPQDSTIQDWDPSAMLSNLSFLEQRIHRLKDLVHVIVGQKGQVLGNSDEILVQQKQLITADLTSIIVQLISTAGNLLPSVKHTLLSTATPIIGQLEQLGEVQYVNRDEEMQDIMTNKVIDYPNRTDVFVNGNGHENHIVGHENHLVEEHESKDDEDAEEGEREHLAPGSYEILQLEKEEILAPHTHFCIICGKGFKRDANLRMHMRGHGDEYKTPAALAKPFKEPNSSEPTLVKRYSCPYSGCKRNKSHKKFQPLKTILCVKNHYKRTHCDKSFICSRCNNKKFSVIADLKTHEKHCGKDKWLCSCGTTFSRKDKLFGHIALFQGHTPAISLDDMKGLAAFLSGSGHGGRAEKKEATTTNKTASINFNTPSVGGVESSNNVVDMMEGNTEEEVVACFSPLNFDTCNFGGFSEFPQPLYDDSDTSFALIMPGSSCNYNENSGGGEYLS